MPALEDEIRRLMTDETARLHAAPDLVERVIRSSRAKRRRTKVAALATSAAVVAAAPLGYLTVGSMTTTAQQQEQPTISTTLEPPAIDDTPPVPSDPPDLGDLGDGMAFGHVRVGYLPERLKWSRWSVDFGDKYSTSYNYESDTDGTYRVQIYMYEEATVEEVDTRIQQYRDEDDGEEVAVGDRTAYLVVQNVGEDGMKGTPTIFLKMGDKQWAEIMFSPVYAKEFSGEQAVSAELKKIAERLTSTGRPSGG
ncbi:hypothetical protein [Nonomuraea sp. NPDC050643]|uniref:hypothetical protein n=1 Tax=Nonomuraea sp. NPDC050643 TaxID=3155660 RepID=UPI0033D9CE13